MKLALIGLLAAASVEAQLVGPTAPAFLCCQTNISTAAEFDPTTIAGMIFWADINRQGLANLQGMGTIVDYSTNNCGCTNLTSSTWPTNITSAVNGRAAAQFDGVNDGMVGGACWTTNQTFCIQVVLQLDNPVGTYTVLSHGSGSTTGYRVLDGANNRQGVTRAIAAQDDGAATALYECWSFRRTSAPNVTLFVNRTNVALSNATAAMNNPSGSLTIGTLELGAPFFAGRIAEIRIWNNDIGFVNESNSFIALCNRYNLP